MSVSLVYLESLSLSTHFSTIKRQAFFKRGWGLIQKYQYFHFLKIYEKIFIFIWSSSLFIIRRSLRNNSSLRKAEVFIRKKLVLSIYLLRLGRRVSVCVTFGSSKFSSTSPIDILLTGKQSSTLSVHFFFSSPEKKYFLLNN